MRNTGLGIITRVGPSGFCCSVTSFFCTSKRHRYGRGLSVKSRAYVLSRIRAGCAGNAALRISAAQKRVLATGWTAMGYVHTGHAAGRSRRAVSRSTSNGA